MLVAPPQACCAGFTNFTHDTAQHQQLMHEMQRLRGGIFLDDGAVPRRDLTADGRHATPEDARSWHLLMTDTQGHVRSCVLFLLHGPVASFEHLRVRHCPLLQRGESRHRVHSAIESEMARARAAGLGFGELGGWAISKERRGSTDGLMLVLAAYGLARILGGALCITTANARSSSPILRRLGGAYLEFEAMPIPSYFDPQYHHEIALLRFDSRFPNPKYAALVEMVIGTLSKVPVVGRSSPRSLTGLSQRFRSALCMRSDPLAPRANPLDPPRTVVSNLSDSCAAPSRRLRTSDEHLESVGGKGMHPI